MSFSMFYLREKKEFYKNKISPITCTVEKYAVNLVAAASRLISVYIEHLHESVSDYCNRLLIEDLAGHLKIRI